MAKKYWEFRIVSQHELQLTPIIFRSIKLRLKCYFRNIPNLSFLLKNIFVRNVGKRICSGSANIYFAVLRVKHNCCFKPDLHKTTRTQYCIGEAAVLQVLFNLPFCISKWKIQINVFGKRSINEIIHPGRFCGVNQVNHPIFIHFLNIIFARLVRKWH